MSVLFLILTSLSALLNQASLGTSNPQHDIMVLPSLANLVIASLGSSYASGPGIDPQIVPAASRSGNNYAHLLANKLDNATLTDLSISGATLTTIWKQSQTAGGTTFPPQLDGVPEDSDLVLILGGGNDVNYNGGLIADSNTTGDFAALQTRFANVLDAIHTKAPSAHVIGVTYLTVLGGDVIPVPEEGANVKFNASRVAYHQGVAEKLRQATLGAFEGREAWSEVLDVVDPSWSHALGSSDPWMNGGDTDPKYHPLAEGHVAIADMLYERLSSETKRKLRRRELKARL